jgi:hypothetical protein
MWIGLIWLRIGTSGWFCESGDEPSGSVKGRTFIDQLRILIASQEGLSVMQLFG